MIIKLPTVKKTPIYNNNELVDIEIKKEYISFNLDMSFYSEQRFDRYFKDTVADKSFTDYVLRITKINPKDAGELRANMISILKVIYCYLESNEVPTFEDFLKLFDYSIAQELLEETMKVINLSQKSIGKN